MTKKLVGILLVFCLLVNTAITVLANNSFTDVSDTHWGYESIELAIQKGYVSGYPDGTFMPNKEVTRAEFMRMLVDALKLPHTEGGSPWYHPYVASLIETNIHREKDFAEGYNQPLSRMEMVRLAVRATNPELQNIDVHMDDNSFMYNATKEGIIHGMEHGELVPDGTSTRAQAVAIIERVLTINEGGSLPTDKRAITYAEVDLKGTNVESATHIELLPLPIEFDYGSDLEVIVDKVIFVDMTDPDAAYRHWFPETIRGLDSRSADDMYLFAIHINVSNTVVDPERREFAFDFVTDGTTLDYQKTIVPKRLFRSGESPISVVPYIKFDELNTVDGWYVVSIPIDKFENNELNKILRLKNGVKQKFEYLTYAR